MGHEIDFLSVGESNGDAICVRYGSPQQGYAIHVIDGGYTDTGASIIDHIVTHYGAPTYVDHVVLSHADNDHVAGLLAVVRHFDVGALWMNRPWLYASEIVDKFHGNFTPAGLQKTIRDAYPLLAELEEIANAKGIPIMEAFAGTRIGAFTVLAPTRDRYVSIIPDFGRTPTSYSNPVKGVFDAIVRAAKELRYYFETWTDETLQENPPACTASNESSVVQMGNFDGRTALLTADVGPIGLNEAANIATHLGMLAPPNFVQVPHHGSRRNVTPTVLNRWLGQPIAEGERRGVAICSVGTNKPKYPRLRVANAFMRRGYPVYKPSGKWIHHQYQLPGRATTPATPVPFATSFEE